MKNVYNETKIIHQYRNLIRTAEHIESQLENALHK